MRYLFLKLDNHGKQPGDNTAYFRDMENQDSDVVKKQISEQLRDEYSKIIKSSTSVMEFVTKLPKWHKKLKKECFR